MFQEIKSFQGIQNAIVPASGFEPLAFLRHGFPHGLIATAARFQQLESDGAEFLFEALPDLLAALSLVGIVARLIGGIVGKLAEVEPGRPFDVIGIANALATVNVNSSTTYRRGEYYQTALAIDNSTTNVWQVISNYATLTGTNQTTPRRSRLSVPAVTGSARDT